MTGADPPEMQIGNAVPLLLDAGSDLPHHVRIGARIEQDGACRADERPRPAQNHDGCDQAHDWVHPDPPKLTADDESKDDQHRNGSVRNDMHEGRAQIMIGMNGGHMAPVFVVIVRMLVTVVMRVDVIMTMMMIVLVAQKIRAQQINAEADHRDWNRLIEGNWYRLDQPFDTLVADA